MAESVVSTVITKLSEMVTEELILLHGVSEEVEWMQRELGWIKCFLKDADAKGKRDERVKHWVNNVTEVAYLAEVVIESFLIKVRQSKDGPSCINRFKPKALIARHHVGVEISKIKKRLNEIKDARERYGIQNLGEDGDASNLISIIRRRHFSPQYSDDADIVGLVNDQKILLERLLMNQQQQGSCVISIVGIGGLGKTTLARKLYRSNAASNHFNKCIWLTVSQQNSLIDLLRKLLKQVAGMDLQNTEENDLIDMINDSLRTQRILIVLDDIWQEDVCIQMQGIFRNLNNGSRVLITTRFVNVAKRADPRSTPYQLQLLNDDEGMKLLLKKAFLYEDADQANCSSELLDIGRRLMRKCGGLPLALSVLGGFLSIRDKTPVVWRRALETMDWEAEETKECQEILALSYEDLPHHMKLCFLYLGAYPEDSEIPGKELIRKWIAEGFIPQEGRKTMEDTAEAILEELIQRSLIHAITRNSNGSVKTCGIHDLLVDFARSTDEKDRFLKVCSNQNDQPFSSTTSTMCHRVAIHIINEPLNDGINARHNKLRTLMAFTTGDFTKKVYSPIISTMFRFQFLRVLDLAGRHIQTRIPTEFKLMIHLRYLRLRLILLPPCDMFPSSVGDLQLLETVHIKYIQMPSTLWNIKTLRHVKCTTCTPPQSLRLENLLTLDCVTFGSHETISWSFPNLRKLKVFIDKEHEGAMLNHLLSELGQLISLHIKALERQIEINTTKDFPFHNRLLSLSLEGLWPMGDTISEFPINLTTIKLRGCRLKEDPMPKLGMLQHLVTLKLISYVYLGETMVCSAGGFPRLESLFISRGFFAKRKTFYYPGKRVPSSEDPMPNLEEWRIERSAMPKLTFLHFTSCKKLKMLPDLQHVMSLQKLELYGMPQELIRRLRREDLHKIQHVPKLTLSPYEV